MKLAPLPLHWLTKCLNDVRNRAGIAPYEEGSLSKEAFRQAVKDERAMELCFEHTRRYDLIRWGEYVKNMNELAPRALQGANANWATGPSYSVYTFFPDNRTLTITSPYRTVKCQ